MKNTLNPALLRWGGLAVIALAELTWLAIRVEVPGTGFLSIFKGFPSKGGHPIIILSRGNISF